MRVTCPCIRERRLLPPRATRSDGARVVVDEGTVHVKITGLHSGTTEHRWEGHIKVRGLPDGAQNAVVHIAWCRTWNLDSGLLNGGAFRAGVACAEVPYLSPWQVPRDAQSTFDLDPPVLAERVAYIRHVSNATLPRPI
jgi:hypothetical protein